MNLLRLGAASALALAVAACASAPPILEVDPVEETGALYADYLRAGYAERVNDAASAAHFYGKALERAPTDRMLLERAVLKTMAAGDIPKAAALAQTLQSLPPPSAVPGERPGLSATIGALAIAGEALARGRPRAARAALEGRDLGPFNSLMADAMLAWSLAAERKTDQALATLDARAQPAGLYFLTAFQRALILDFAGREEEALAAYEEAWDGGVRLAQGLDAYGRALERNGKSLKALELYSAFIDEVGDNPVILAAIARVKAGEPAGRYISRPAEGAAMAVFAPAAALAASQVDDSVARAYLQLALRLNPQLDAARAMLAAELEDAGRGDDAIAVFRQVPQSSPYFTAARIEIMWELTRQERYDAARAVAEETLAQAPSLATRIALADFLRAREDWAGAEKLYDAAIRDEGEAASWRLYFSRGAARERLGRWGEAQADLKQALSLSPNEPEVLNYLGYSWVDRHENLTEALAMIERAVALRPNAGFIVDSLGWAHFKLGDYDKAVRYLERAVELTPQDPTLNDHLGDAYWKVGRKVEAQFQWRRALSLKPSDKDRALIEAKVRDGLVASVPGKLAVDEPAKARP